MPTFYLSARHQPVSTPAVSMRPWMLGVGAVVIAMQLTAVGVVVNRQVEQAASKQMVQQPLQSSASVDMNPSNMAQ